MDPGDERLAMLTDHEEEVWLTVMSHLQSAVAVTCFLISTL